jgi:rhomboid protease GluP
MPISVGEARKQLVGLHEVARVHREGRFTQDRWRHITFAGILKEPSGSTASRHRSGGNMQEQENVRARDGDDGSSSVLSEQGVPSRPVDRRIFQVGFGQRVGMTTVPADAFRFTGKGSLEIDEPWIRIAGLRKRPFWFGEKDSHGFARSDVLNVHRAGKTVRFSVRSGDIPLRIVQFTASSEAEAVVIEAALPREQTPEFTATQAELSAFHQRLNRLSPRAPVTPAIVTINVAVFIAMCVGGAGFFDSDGTVAVRWGSNFGPLTMGGEWWRLFTAMFIHFGVIHLLLNMWALYQTGRTVERLFGSVRFTMLYVFAGLAGSIASLLWNPEVNSAGASGAIFGVFGGMLAFVLNPRNGVPKSVAAEHRNSTLLFAGYSLFYGFAHAGIDNAAHIGGLLGGLGMGFLLAGPVTDDARANKGAGRGVVAALVGVLALGALAWPLMHPSARVQGDLAFQHVRESFHDRESTAIEATNALVAKTAKGQLSESEFAGSLRKDVIPAWDRMHDDIIAAKLDPDDGQYPFQQALLRYVDCRREELRTYVQDGTADDAGLAERIKSAHRNTNKALEELNALIEAGK